MDTLVSVILPVYNRAKVVQRCLDSLLSQTYSNIEIVCVDDCSTDNTLSVLNQYAARDKRVKVIHHEKNLNAGGARNTAIANARGEYIYLTDSDDWVEPYAISDVMSATDNGYFDIVLSPLRIYESKEYSYMESYPDLGSDYDAIIEYGFMNGLRGVGSICRRSIWIDNNIRYPEHIFYEDNAIAMIPSLLATSVKIIPQSSYNVDASDLNSSCRTIDSKHIEDRTTSCDLWISNMKAYGFYEKYKVQIDYKCLRLHLNTLKNILSHCEYNKETRTAAEDMGKNVSSLLPNKYFEEMSIEDKSILLNPINYLKEERNKRIKNNIKSFFHSIRHNIVVAVKKVLGKDPTKSIYNK